MKIGSEVTWTTAAGATGSGLVIGNAFTPNAIPHWLVAVDSAPGEEHRVIWCAETWLKEVP